MAEQQQQTGADRMWLIAVDDSDDSQKAFSWALQHMYREGDQVHIVHVVPRLAFAAQVRTRRRKRRPPQWAFFVPGTFPKHKVLDACWPAQLPAAGCKAARCRLQSCSFAATLPFVSPLQYGVPPVDFVPAADSSSYETAVQRAEQFIIDRFVKELPATIKAPVVHIIKVGVMWTHGMAGAGAMQEVCSSTMHEHASRTYSAGAAADPSCVIE